MLTIEHIDKIEMLLNVIWFKVVDNNFHDQLL